MTGARPEDGWNLLPAPPQFSFPDPRPSHSGGRRCPGSVKGRPVGGPVPPALHRTTASDRPTSSLVEINSRLSPRRKLRHGGWEWVFSKEVGSVSSSEASAHPLGTEVSPGDGAGEISAPCHFSGTSPPKAQGTPRLGRRRPVPGWTRPGWGCGLRWGSPEPGRRRGGGQGARGAGPSSPLRLLSPPSGSQSESRAEAAFVGACAAARGRG